MNTIDRRHVDLNVIGYYLDKYREDFHKQENERRNELKQEYLTWAQNEALCLG
jgi:hypothetical protein